MAEDISSLDQQYIESLQLRNALVKQLNASLQIQVSEAQGRLGAPAGPPPGTTTPLLGLPNPKEPIPNPATTTTTNPKDDTTLTKTTPENKEPTEKKRFRVVVNIWKKETQKWEDSEYKPSTDVDANGRCITYRRLMDSENERKCWSEECEIPLQGLRILLRDSMAHVESEWFETEFNGFESPFANIVYNWGALEGACRLREGDDNEMRESRGDLRLLLDNVRVSEPRNLKAYFKNRDSHLRAKTVTFGTLWTLFQPGTKVMAKPFMDEWQMFEVQRNWSYSNPPRMNDPDEGEEYDQYRYFNLYCAGFDWDGRHFRRYTYHFRFDKFEGRRLIAGLQCFPVEYWSAENSRPELPALKEKLIERGKKFAKLCTAQRRDYACKYSGFLLYGIEPRNFREDSPRTIRREIKKQSVIVDNASFMESRRNKVNSYFTCPPLGHHTWQESLECCPCGDCRNGPIQSWSGNDFEDPQAEMEEFTKEPDRLLMCPPKVLGYVSMERIWAQFSVDRVEKIEPEQKEKDKLTFEQKLELDRKHKDMLLALIKNHESPQDKASGLPSTSTVQDPIDGKGRGLAILLHGPPGVGKTLTAEAVALATAKPLLPVSVAELGDNPYVAEANLLDVFEDASRWDAVMVIDEADVFLEERIGTTDVNRNALVSVLLRVLEYYDGIIILTTNRITSLDVAVQSRMHLAIQYKDFSHEQKKNIFMKFLDDVAQNEVTDRERINRELDFFCKRTDLNGRQIRNIVSGAQALAKSERRKLSYEHLAQVYDATSDFVQSLKDLTLQKRGRNEAPR